MTLDPVLVASLRGSLVLLFAAAAVHKARDFGGFVAVVRGYRLAPPRTSAPLAACVLAVEATIAVALLSPARGSTAAFAAAVLLALYGGAIAWNLARGRRDVDCGCFGPAGRQTIGEGLVVRNATLALAALAATARASARELVWLDALTVAFAIGALALVFLAASHLLARADLRLLGWRTA